MLSATMQHGRPATPMRVKVVFHTFAVVVGWMFISSVLGALIMGLAMDGILRTLLDNKDHELLSSHYLTLSFAYRAEGLPAVEKLLRRSTFQDYYIQLTDPSGKILLEQNPGHVRFTQPLLPMTAINGSDEVRDWQETHTSDGLDYDLLSRPIVGGTRLLMGLCERPQEEFFHRVEKIMTQIGGGFIAVGLIGAILLILQFRQVGKN